MELFSNFQHVMQEGGPVMWIILVTAWLAIVMLIERGVQIQAWVRRAIHDQLQFDKDANYVPSVAAIRKASPISSIMKSIDWHSIENKDDLAKHLNIHLAELMPKLEGVLPTIAVLGTLLPMLGLLGTVMGMIEVFEVIALHGTGNSREMAHGISQALLTTASGLFIAIPVIFFHHLLVKRLRFLLAVTEQSLLTVYKRRIDSTGTGR